MTVQLRGSVQSLKRAKNKGIQQKVEEMNITRQKAEACIRNFRLAHSTNYLKILFKNRRTIYTACSLGTPIHLACNHVKTSRCLRKASVNAVSNAVPAVLILIQIRITSYLNAAASPVFETAKFEVFRPTHARGNLPRQFSVLIHVSRFSEVSHPTPICRRCQEHFATYLPSS